MNAEIETPKVLTTQFKKFLIVSPFVYGLIHEMLSFVINHFDNFL